MIMIRNMKMLTKMLMLILVAIIFLVAVGLVGFIYMDRMARNTEEMYENNFTPLNLFTTVDSNVKETRAYIFEILLTEDPARIRQLEANIMANNEGTLQTLEELGNVQNKTAEGLELYNEIMNVSEDFQKHREHVINLALEGQNEEAYTYYMDNVRDLQNLIIANIEELRERLVISTAELNEQNIQNERFATSVVVGSIIAAIILLLLIGWGNCHYHGKTGAADPGIDE